MAALTFLVGHRGVGKTSLLRRIEQYLPDVRVYDLDAEIEKSEGETIAQIFRVQGEAYFRAAEQKVLVQLIKSLEHPFSFIALGAGFKGSLPPGARIIWVKRAGDTAGRIFAGGGRPRLDGTLHPLDEYRQRWAEREARFRKIATDILVLKEGMAPRDFDRAESTYFSEKVEKLHAVLTLLPEHLSRPQYAEALRRYQRWGVFFELRDDLLSEIEIQKVLAIIPTEQILLAQRGGTAFTNLSLPKVWQRDSEALVPGNHSIVSRHERAPVFAETLGELEQIKDARIIKFAPLINSLSELKAGHEWWLADTRRRVFLPRSEGPVGRWTWYRLWTFYAQAFSFFREDQGSAPDQPTLLQLLSFAPRSFCPTFAAVLGHPVDQSQSPTAHEDFFGLRGMPVYAIDILPEENFSEALDVLAGLGLRCAAVTSPHKISAFYKAAVKNSELVELGTANTLYFDGELWHAHNTDLIGMESLAEGVDRTFEVVVWGGGGVLPTVQKAFPHASFYSARHARARTHSRSAQNPGVLVWAAEPRAPGPDTLGWQPEWVLDLNYREDSEARAYAQRVGACYVSGDKMFARQAAGQREFWGQCLPISSEAASKF